MSRDTFSANIVTFVCIASCLLALPARGQVRYRVKDLGPQPSEPLPHPHSINAFAQVAGEAGWDAFLLSHGHIRYLGTLGGLRSWARDINDHSVIVGESHAVAAHDIRAFVWANGEMTNLGTLPGGTYSTARGINNYGQIVGVSDMQGSEIGHAFLYEHRIMRDLGTLPGGFSSGAWSINNKGEIAGNSDTWVVDHYEHHAALWDDGAIIDLGTLGGKYSLAYDINDHREVVGYSRTGEVAEIDGYEVQVEHAFLWRENRLLDLGTLGGPISIARGINNDGIVVGEADEYSDDGVDINRQATIWYDGVAIDLNDLISPDAGWFLWRANAVNEAGQIVGRGFKVGSLTHAFLLTPVPCPSCPPPTRVSNPR